MEELCPSCSQAVQVSGISSARSSVDRCIVAVLLYEFVSGAVDVEVGGHPIYP